MPATANPHFDLQHQAISSLRQIHRICLGLEGAQVVTSFGVMAIGFLSHSAAPALPRIIHFYGAMIYFFLAVFAHVVVYYVLLAMGRNVSSAFIANPQGVSQWLVVATRRLKYSLIPFFTLHAVALIANALTSSFWSEKPSSGHQIAAWASALIGAATFARVWFALKRNIEYLTSFVTTGGFTGHITRNL